jgi:mannose-6-phosphate isomerase-like protein (cupin superfamily)
MDRSLKFALLMGLLILGYSTIGLAQDFDFKKLIQDNPLRAGAAMKRVDLGQDDKSSKHLVIIRTNEYLHMHNHHDSTVVLVEGKGILYLQGERLPLKKGDEITIPRGVPHYFTNTDKEPSVAFMVFTPPFDGSDIIRIQSPTTDFLQ